MQILSCRGGYESGLSSALFGMLKTSLWVSSGPQDRWPSAAPPKGLGSAQTLLLPEQEPSLLLASDGLFELAVHHRAILHFQMHGSRSKKTMLMRRHFLSRRPRS